MNAITSGDRFVLPQWLPFDAASRLREASVLKNEVSFELGRIISPAYQEALGSFLESPSAFLATDLMGTAFALNDGENAKRLAEFVLTQPETGIFAQRQARRILGFQVPVGPAIAKDEIRRIKAVTNDGPLNVIAWIERARFYTILGQKAKARRSVFSALHLAPSNRFVVRAAIRFFIHCGDWATAKKVAERAYALNQDPLIFGPLLSVANQIGKLPRNTKEIVKGAFNSDKKFLNSEILEAAGTMEILSGADNRARKLFREAWKDPSKAVVTHSQWVLREHLPNIGPEQPIDFSQSQEALSWLKYALLDFSGSLESCRAWALEEPYSKGPHILGSLAACQDGKFEAAVRLARDGLAANPKDMILQNNLAFALLHDGKIEAAETALAPLVAGIQRDDNIAPTATYGMLCMAKGNFKDGERYYGLSVQRALDSGDRALGLRAALNFQYSSMVFEKVIDVPLLNICAKALGNFSDASCLGVARAIAGRLHASDLKGSDELSTAARSFIHAHAEAHANYVEWAKVSFKIPENTKPAELSLPKNVDVISLAPSGKPAEIYYTYSDPIVGLRDTFKRKELL